MKLHQDAQFVPTRENVSLLLNMYGLTLAGYETADSGIENCTIMIRALSGKYVLRVYRQHKKNHQDVQGELDFVMYLGENGIPVAPPLPNLERSLVSWLDQSGYTWRAILMRHAPGGHPDRYSSGLIVNLATIQARMHNLAALYTPKNAYNKELTELKETHFIRLIKDRKALEPNLQDFVTRAENYVVHLDSSLPKGLCHLDFDRDNVLCRRDVVTAVLDFDDLMLAPYVVCLAYALWDVAYDLGLDGSAAYIEAYEKIRQLTDQEKSFIKPIMLLRHYAIGCMDISHKQMDESALSRLLNLERELLSL